MAEFLPQGNILSILLISIKECVFHASRQTKIVKAALGNDAGMYGAAKLILGN